MIRVSRTPEFSNCGNMNSVSVCTSSDQDMASMAGSRGRQRSHSYYSPEDCKNYGVQTQTEEANLRPRSRYVFIINLFFHPNDVSDQTTEMFIHIHMDFFFCCGKIGLQTDHEKNTLHTLINTEWTALQVILQFWDIRASHCLWRGSEAEGQLNAAVSRQQKGKERRGRSWCATHLKEIQTKQALAI